MNQEGGPRTLRETPRLSQIPGSYEQGQQTLDQPLRLWQAVQKEATVSSYSNNGPSVKSPGAVKLAGLPPL